ncbi:hypothetical protein [Aureimonas populi]|uniref:DUF1344 domain-containing protein n=1 Tax=Aureimonas populi TaxID=1701758 RepID=A0ABW5CIW7_9HYPH|nr:hypothetical protein [Aureimonas populi]
MSARIVALFGCSALAVAASIPDSAQDASGRVALVGEDFLVLDDGRRYALPDTLGSQALRPGMTVHLIVVEAA